MSGVRRGLAVGLALSAPVALWTLPQLGDGGPGATAVVAGALAGLWLALALATPLFGAWIAAEPSLGRAGAGLAMLLLTPIPVLTVLWLTGEAAAPLLGRGLGVCAGWAALCLAAVRASGGAAPAGSARAGLLGCGLAALALTSRAAWLGWIDG